MKIRIMYAIILAILVPLGLGSRYYFHQGLFHIYGGDVLYATFFYFCFRFLKPELSFKYAAVFSLLFCYGIEISQFYQAPWITEIRHTFLGGLILGFGFLWSDIICYTLGVLLGFVIDVWLYKSIESQELSTISRSK